MNTGDAVMRKGKGIEERHMHARACAHTHTHTHTHTVCYMGSRNVMHLP